MKKMLALIITFALLLPLASCGNNTPSSDISPSSNTQFSSTTSSSLGTSSSDNNSQPKVYYYLHDQWNLYKAIFLSDTTVKIENWYTPIANNTNYPFEYERDICIININDSSSSFAWTDTKHVAFTISMQDTENSHWGDLCTAFFTIDSSSIPTDKILTYLHDKWNLYKAYLLSETTIKIENWGTAIANDEDYPFEYQYDVCIIELENSSTDFTWTDSDQVAFTFSMHDQVNSHWEQMSTAYFTIDVNNVPNLKTYSFLHDKWNLYKAYLLSENTIKIENWGTAIANDEDYPFEYQYDVYILNIANNQVSFSWVSNDYVAFTVTMNDIQNSRWADHSTAMFSITN